jgi:hypothetical protein
MRRRCPLLRTQPVLGVTCADQLASALEFFAKLLRSHSNVLLAPPITRHFVTALERLRRVVTTAAPPVRRYYLC